MVAIMILTVPFSNAQNGPLDLHPVDVFKKSTFVSGNHMKIEIEKPPVHYSAFNTTLEFSSGWSTESFRINSLVNHLNDSSEVSYQADVLTPVYSFSADFIMGPVFSVGIGVHHKSQSIQQDNQEIIGSRTGVTIQPRLTVVNRPKFDYFIGLNLTYAYTQTDLGNTDLIVQRLLPEKHRLYTGVTLAGLHFKWSDHLGCTFKYSLWSQESMSLGVTYRFLAGEKN